MEDIAQVYQAIYNTVTNSDDHFLFLLFLNKTTCNNTNNTNLLISLAIEG